MRLERFCYRQSQTSDSRWHRTDQSHYKASEEAGQNDWGIERERKGPHRESKGKPVEEQVRDHPGVTRAAVAYRPLSTFSTFSMWRSEEEMLGMVGGRRANVDGSEHREAMKERARKPFHHEFTTMRLVPLSEHGEWPRSVRLLSA